MEGRITSGSVVEIGTAAVSRRRRQKGRAKPVDIDLLAIAGKFDARRSERDETGWR
jgi:hypothetical protein